MWIPQFLRGVFPNSLLWCCFLAFMLFACLNAVSLLWCCFLVFMPFPCFDAVSLLSCFWCHFCWWSEKWKKKNHRIWKRASPVSTPWFRDNHLPLVNRMALPKWFSRKQPQAVFGEKKKKMNFKQHGFTFLFGLATPVASDCIPSRPFGYDQV